MNYFTTSLMKNLLTNDNNLPAFCSVTIDVKQFYIKK
jgi:hypothetical protein